MSEPYQERVILERKELAEKTNKLVAFLFGVTFNSLDAMEQARLLKQYACMQFYLGILDERIAAF